MNPMKKVQREWEEFWSKGSIQREIAQIGYETYYTSFFQSIFEPGGLVLEAGCGFGRYCFWLEERGISSIGVDVVRRALATGAKWAKSRGYASYFVLGDVTRLPFKHAVFDGCISLGVIEHFRSVEEIRNFFAEVNRVLKDGGKSFVAVPNPIALHQLLLPILYHFGCKADMFFKPLDKKTLCRISENEGFRVLKIYVCDFYFPFYTLLSSLFRSDLWTVKGIMKKSLNVFDRVPIFKEMGSGIHMILQKNAPKSRRSSDVSEEARVAKVYI